VKIIKFKGGLGNQLFQYAFLRNLEITYHCKNVRSDFSYYEAVDNDSIRKPRIINLNISHNQINTTELQKMLIFNHNTNPTKFLYRVKIFLEKTLNKKYLFEKNRAYIDINKILDFNYYDGYWQSWLYFREIEDCLRREITPKIPLNIETKNLINDISKKNMVFVGIRRGDYLANRKAKKHFGDFDQEYFDKALKIIKEKVKNPQLLIFSNDIKWVKENLKFNCESTYREDSFQVSDL